MTKKTPKSFPSMPGMQPFEKFDKNLYMHMARRMRYIFTSHDDTSLIAFVEAIPGFWRAVEAVGGRGEKWLEDFCEDFHTTQYSRKSKRVSADELLELGPLVVVDSDCYFTRLMEFQVEEVMDFISYSEANGYMTKFNDIIDQVDSQIPWFKSMVGYLIFEEAVAFSEKQTEYNIYMEASNGSKDEDTERMHQKQPVHRKTPSI